MKIGDSVKIKEGLEVGNLYGSESFVSDMKKYCGRQARITDIRGESYELDIDNGDWNWTVEMLEPIKKYEVTVSGNTVTVKDDKGNMAIATEDELSTGISIAISRLGKPSLGERYYSVNFIDTDPVICYHWADDYADNTLFERGLIFKTKEEARKVAKIMLDSIKE